MPVCLRTVRYLSAMPPQLLSMDGQAVAEVKNLDSLKTVKQKWHRFRIASAMPPALSYITVSFVL